MTQRGQNDALSLRDAGTAGGFGQREQTYGQTNRQDSCFISIDLDVILKQ